MIQDLKDIIEIRETQIQSLEKMCSDRHDDRMRMSEQVEFWQNRYAIVLTLLVLTWAGILIRYTTSFMP